MKKLIALFFAISLLSMACKKENETANGDITLDPTDKVLSSGSFVNGSGHTTTGEVKLIQSADQKKYLIFTNLKTDNGPDLRVYLAEDNAAKGFTEVANKVVNGNTKLEVPSSANTDKQKAVLIWCKQFSVLFGSAALK
jgi:hypothetical protein